MNTSSVFALVDSRKTYRNILRTFLEELDPGVQVAALKNSGELFDLLSNCPCPVLCIHNNTTPESGICVAHRIHDDPILSARKMKLLIYGDGGIEIPAQELDVCFICTDGKTEKFVERFCAEAGALWKGC